MTEEANNSQLNMEQNLQQTVLQKIANDHIQPRARFWFMGRYIMLWLPGIVITGLGAVAVAGLLFGAMHAGWEAREFTTKADWELWVRAVPVIWIMSEVLFLLLIVKALRVTDRGYRYTAGSIILTSVLISVVAGGLLFFLDQKIQPNSFIRYPVENRERAMWSRPEVGRLVGTIQKTEGEDVILVDLMNKEWELNIDQLPDNMPVVDQSTVRVVGMSLPESQFLACAVLPWDLTPNKPPIGNKRVRKPVTPANLNCEDILKQLRQNFRERKVPAMP